MFRTYYSNILADSYFEHIIQTYWQIRTCITTTKCVSQVSAAQKRDPRGHHGSDRPSKSVLAMSMPSDAVQAPIAPAAHHGASV